MEGGERKLCRNNVGELGLEVSNIGIEGSLAAITTSRSEITSDGSSGGCATRNGHGTLLLFKKKRGRPRKYDSNGNFIRRQSVPPSSLSPPLPSVSLNHQRDRQQSLGINAIYQQDVAEKVLAAFQTGPRCISILSATGMAYNVVIRQPASSSYAHLLKFEGVFEILRLSGSLTISENAKIKTGGLSVLLSCTNGNVISGTLGGSLLAATPVQIVVGSFIPTKKHKHPKKRHQYGLRMSTAPNVGHDPEVGGTLENPVSLARPVHKLQVTSHEPAPIPVETNDGGTSYTKKKAKSIIMIPSWNVKPSPDLNVDASME